MLGITRLWFDSTLEQRKISELSTVNLIMENPILIGKAQLHLGECIEVMATIPENSLDSIICDPPYLLNFMGKAFDSQHKQLPGENEGQKMQEWHRRWVTEAYRILKPGGHLAAFGGDRTHHRLMSAMEDVGFELRQCGYWIFSQGFPKSQNASLALDQHFGMKDKREVVGMKIRPDGSCRPNAAEWANGMGYQGNPATPEEITESAHPIAKQWAGYGTALKPATEIVAIGRKPMIGTLAENLLTWGCGAMNLDACRVAIDESVDDPRLGGKGAWKTEGMAKNIYEGGYRGDVNPSSPLGRFPPHLLHDGSDVVKKCFPISGSGNFGKEYCYSGREYNNRETSMFNGDKPQAPSNYNDSGSSARFFPSLPYDEEDCATLYYCGKASKEDRGSFNNHVSVKPTSLMRWICRLLTPKGGTLLDPFMGSGSTLKAASLEGFKCIGIEMDPDYFEIAKARVIDANKQPSMDLFSEAA